MLFVLCAVTWYIDHDPGVGGFVLNDKNEVLVVTEKNGPVTGIWKMPGGSVNAGKRTSTATIISLWLIFP
jgi:ADP-ribose pyrophosphatase YjhB (NUDIX family)